VCVCVCVCFSFVINVKLHYILLSVIACFTLLVDSRSFDKAKWMIFVTFDKYSCKKKKMLLKNSGYMSHNSLDI